jgi:hypothetical protein
MDTKQQTAVEWLFGQIPSACKSSKGAFDALQQAKEMEKEQIKIAYYNGTTDEIKTKEELLLDAEHYYNETFGGEQ